MPPQRVIHGLRLLGYFLIYNAEDVVVDAARVQAPDGMNHLVIGGLALGGFSAAVVDVLCAVQGYAHQEIAIRQHLHQRVIHCYPVGLQGVVNGQMARVVFFDQTQPLAVKTRAH